MERETTTFTVPSGLEIVVKSYLTAREANAIKEEMLKNMKVTPSGETISELPGTFILEQEKKLLTTIVVSLGGSSENLSERLLDMRNEDYQVLIAKVNEINQGKALPK